MTDLPEPIETTERFTHPRSLDGSIPVDKSPEKILHELVNSHNQLLAYLREREGGNKS